MKNNFWKKSIGIFTTIFVLSLTSGCSTISDWFNGNKDEKIAKWDECTKASCWNGANAQQRMMNMLSPRMSDEKFTNYMNWMKSRGCNTAHLFVSNQNNGENAGYSIYGLNWSWNISENNCNIIKSRIGILRENGFAIVLWLFADDSVKYNSEAKKNFQKYLEDLKEQGILKYASTVVVGLELNEYYNATDVATLITATRSVYSGKIGTHQTSGKYDYSKLADLCFYQINPGKSVQYIQNEVVRVKNATGRPVNMFELERNPNRPKCEAAISAGAFGVGNW